MITSFVIAICAIIFIIALIIMIIDFVAEWEEDQKVIPIQKKLIDINLNSWNKETRLWFCEVIDFINN